ncbi:MAG: MBL fold metallo-hydrolase [Thermodesulfobacteriota bacterium]|nr:MBL fold metallo-hydrolase [Thermodesulfobacteriota bacterium]
MGKKVKVTVVVENSAGKDGMISEHGMCFWIETGSTQFIFDTGQGGALLNNARIMGIPLEKAESVVLSHGHFDHTGGLKTVLHLSLNPKVYAHQAAFKPKFACNEYGQSRSIGMPSMNEKSVRELAGDIIFTTRCTQIADRLFVTGEIPRVTEFEDTGGPFFLDEGCRKPDPFLDDQALFFDSSGGTVVLLGCAHAGVINTLLYIQQLTHGKTIHAVMGGMHLLSASPKRMDNTIEYMARINPDLLGPAHCTGRAATAELWEAFSQKCFPCPAGTFIEFD